MNRDWTALLLCSLAGVAAQSACSSSAKPPGIPPPANEPPADTATTPATATRPAPAKLDDVVETIHGTKVRDPYRWMEQGGPAFDAFVKEQDDYARKTLAAIRGRDRLRDQIHEANRGVTRVDIAGLSGSLTEPRVFLFKRAPDDDTSQLYVREGWGGEDRLLFDPRSRDQGDVHYSIDYAVPSPDGKHVAVGTSSSGSEDSVIEVLALGGNAGSKDRDRWLPEKIDRAQYAHLSWFDDKSFFHWRRRAPAPNEPAADLFKFSATYLHVLGEDPEREQPVFSASMKELGLAPEVFNSVSSTPNSPWLLATASTGTSADAEYFVAPRSKLVPGKTPWRRITGPNDGVTSIDAHGDTLYAFSYAGAPRWQILSFDAKKGTIATAKPFVPEGDVDLESFVMAKDAIYLQLFDGGKTLIERVSYDGKKREKIQLPFEGTAYPWSEPARPGFLFTGQGWTVPWREYRFDPKAGFRELKISEPWPTGYSHLTSELVEAKSADGTMVPLSITRRKDRPLDGSAPALLDGYQAYGETEMPYFWPLQLVWVERGGVLAVCHGRGSGNRGKNWHLGGIKHNKERGVEDFLACSQYLIDHQYTAAARLTVTGTSAGGLLVGGAVTRSPELFAAALLRVPVLNLSRFESTESGPANVPEYGSIADEQDFKAILASDPYQRLKEGTRYPALVVTASKHDTRVPAWVAGKFIARAQAVDGGDKPLLFRVEREAGHFGSTRTQSEEEWADLYAFALWQSGIALDQ
jgi:prolyl oligopeptidase